MKIRVVVGSVDIRLDGLDLDLNQIRRLLTQAGSIALAVDKPDDDDDDDTAPRPVGFTAHLDIASPIEVDMSEWYDEE